MHKRRRGAGGESTLRGLGGAHCRCRVSCQFVFDMPLGPTQITTNKWQLTATSARQRNVPPSRCIPSPHTLPSSSLSCLAIESSSVWLHAIADSRRAQLAKCPCQDTLFVLLIYVYVLPCPPPPLLSISPTPPQAVLN